MPFFCDIAVDSNNQVRNPELIPYTQELQYNNSTSGTDKWTTLIVAPYSGHRNAGRFQVNNTWGNDNFGKAYEGIKSEAQSDISAANATALYSALNADISKLDDALTLNDANGIANILKAFIPADNIQKYMAMQNSVDELKKICTKIKQSLATSVKDYRTTTSGSNTNDSAQDRSVHWEAQYNPNSATPLFTGSEYKVSNGSNSTYSIATTLVCKSSDDTTSARDVVLNLAEILVHTTPCWRASSESVDNKSTTIYSIRLQAPNDFSFEVNKDLKTDGGSTNGDMVISTDLIKCHNQFRLRQGFDLYSDLVPSSVEVTTSTDLIRIPGTKGDIFNSEGISPTNTQANSNANAENADGKKLTNLTTGIMNKTKSVRATYLNIWNKISELNEVTQIANPEKKACIYFPQYITVRITLQRVSPYDGVTAAAQMFNIGTMFGSASNGS